MSISVVTNLGSLSSQSKLSATSNALNKTIQRLSSGLRINNSGDDAAGLAVANAFRSDISKLRQGIRNANDGVSTLQIIDGGLSTISGLVDRAMTLATQSASDTFTGDRDILNNEFTQVTAEISRQAQNIGLADGATTAEDGRNNAALNVFIGGGTSANSANNSVAVDLSDATNQVDAAGLGIDSLSLSTASDASDAIDTLRTAVGTLGTVQGRVGAYQNNLSQAIDLAMSQITNYQAAESRIRDTDMAAEASDMSRLSVLQQSGVAALAQANQSSQAILSLLR